jgi:hypothetical protein
MRAQIREVFVILPRLTIVSPHRAPISRKVRPARWSAPQILDEGQVREVLDILAAVASFVDCLARPTMASYS